MWLKSAVRQLAKWVPTSTEIRNDAKIIGPPPSWPAIELPFTAPVIDDDQVLDGELVGTGNDVIDAPDMYYDVPPEQ